MSRCAPSLSIESRTPSLHLLNGQLNKSSIANLENFSHQSRKSNCSHRFFHYPDAQFPKFVLLHCSAARPAGNYSLQCHDKSEPSPRMRLPGICSATATVSMPNISKTESKGWGSNKWSRLLGRLFKIRLPNGSLVVSGESVWTI